jgi:GNAT superfamily N-acetyltransferase
MGKGAGSLLLKASLDYLRDSKFTKAILWVLTSNRKTRDWYESKGWKVEGTTTVDIRDGFELHETRYIIDL